MALMWLPFGLTPKPKTYGGVHYADIYARALAAAVDMFLIFFVLQNFCDFFIKQFKKYLTILRVFLLIQPYHQ